MFEIVVIQFEMLLQTQLVILVICKTCKRNKSYVM